MLCKGTERDTQLVFSFFLSLSFSFLFASSLYRYLITPFLSLSSCLDSSLSFFVHPVFFFSILLFPFLALFLGLFLSLPGKTQAVSQTAF
jgi:hypothetical protein